MKSVKKSAPALGITSSRLNIPFLKTTREVTTFAVHGFITFSKN